MMNPAIVLGLVSALLYGLTDFVSHFASARAGVLRTLLYGQAAVAIALTLVVLAVGRIAPAAPERWALLFGSDMALLVATLCLYRALATGDLAVVPPVTACYGAVTAAISIATGEHVGCLALAGLGLAIAGGVIAAVPARGARREAPGRSRGVAPAAAAAALYGVGFWLQGRYVVPHFGELTPVWSYYVVGSISVGAFMAFTRRDARPPSRAEAPAIFATAALAAAGYAALTLGAAAGQVAVVTALSSIAAAVTVVLARVFLHQHVAVHGWFGLASVVVGLMVLRLA